MYGLNLKRNEDHAAINQFVLLMVILEETCFKRIQPCISATAGDYWVRHETFVLTYNKLLCASWEQVIHDYLTSHT